LSGHKDKSMSRRPESFHGFFGHRKIVRFLTKQLAGAQALGQPCPNLLFTGPSGAGKTTLAKALAIEAGTQCRVLHGKATPRHLCEALVELAKGDFIFLDEAHNLPRDAQEYLYELIDAGKVSDRLDDVTKGKRDPDGKLLIEPVTVVLATNQPGKLLQALRKRMEYTIALGNYSEAELVEIAASAASDLGVLVSPQALKRLAKAAQWQPRRALHLLRGMRLHYHADLSHQLSTEDVRRFLVEAGTDEQGLDAQQQRYLRKLYRLKSASLATLASLLGSDAEDVADYVEPGLIKLDFIRKCQVGRKLTQTGREWAKLDRAQRKARRQKGSAA
jgi:Holliday junction resolvasome RuvABC ATP-dependent DNA helicase subunit